MEPATAVIRVPLRTDYGNASRQRRGQSSRYLSVKKEGMNETAIQTTDQARQPNGQRGVKPASLLQDVQDPIRLN
jgi:hypothetical protein